MATRTQNKANETEAVYETVSVPVVTRTRKPNPHAGAVAALAADVNADGRSNGARAMLVPNDKVKREVSRLQAAGKDAGVTVRHTTEDAGNGKTRLVFWTIKRVTRPRKASK